MVSVFWQNPYLTVFHKDYGVADIVCAAKTTVSYHSLVSFFRCGQRPLEVECVSQTREVIIRGTNQGKERIEELQKFLTLSS